MRPKIRFCCKSCGYINLGALLTADACLKCGETLGVAEEHARMMAETLDLMYVIKGQHLRVAKELEKLHERSKSFMVPGASGSSGLSGLSGLSGGSGSRCKSKTEVVCTVCKGLTKVVVEMDIGVSSPEVFTMVCPYCGGEGRLRKIVRRRESDGKVETQ